MEIFFKVMDQVLGLKPATSHVPSLAGQTLYSFATRGREWSGYLGALFV